MKLLLHIKCQPQHIDSEPNISLKYMKNLVTKKLIWSIGVFLISMRLICKRWMPWKCQCFHIGTLETSRNKITSAIIRIEISLQQEQGAHDK